MPLFPTGNFLIDRMLEVPRFRRLFVQRVLDVLDGPLAPATFEPQVSALYDLVREAQAADPQRRESVAEFEAEQAVLLWFARERSAFLRREFAACATSCFP